MKKKLIIFMPSIEGGGVEKNLFIISNYLAKKINNITLITASKKFKNKFESLNFVTPYFNIWDSFGRRVKYFICLLILFKIVIFNKNVLVFAFQANLYCIVFCKLFNIKVITRSNSSPSGWSKNKIKTFIYKKILNLSDQIIVNSLEFKKELKLKFNVRAKCIYNPLNKKEIETKSRHKFKFPFFNKEKNYLKIINVGRFVDQKDHFPLLTLDKFWKK